MSTLQHSIDVDLESAIIAKDGGATDVSAVSGGGGPDVKMSTLQQLHLEPAIKAKDGGGDGGVGGVTDVAAVGGSGGAEANEIVENNGSKKDKDERRESNVSEYSVDLESGLKLHLATMAKRDCRICQLSMDASNQDSEIPIELGCSCKDDLAAAHKQCAEAWFKIKGNKTCEICGSIAQNVAGINEAELMEQWNETNDATATATATSHAPLSQSRRFWQGHRLLNFLLACTVFAFVISWLFHFNVPS